MLLVLSAGLVRTGLRSLINGEHDIAVVGEASSGEEAVRVAIDTRPDVVIIDLRLGRGAGLMATRGILANPRLPHTRVVILAADESEEDLRAAVQSGVSGFVLLDSDPEDLLRSVRVVACGGAQLSPWATRLLLEEFASMPAPTPAHSELFEELTTREREIVSLVAQGLSNGEIARKLVVSPATVKTHVSRSMVKLRVRARAKLVALAYQTGFVRPHRALDRNAES